MKEAKTENLPSHGGSRQERNLGQINLESRLCRERVVQAGKETEARRQRRGRRKVGWSWAAPKNRAGDLRLNEGGREEPQMRRKAAWLGSTHEDERVSETVPPAILSYFTSKVSNISSATRRIQNPSGKTLSQGKRSSSSVPKGLRAYRQQSGPPARPQSGRSRS